MAGVFVEQAGKKPCAEVGPVSLIQEASPDVGVKTIRALTEDRMRVNAFCRERIDSEKDERRIV